MVKVEKVKLSWRKRFWNFLRKDVMKIAQGQILPWYGISAFAVLFPLRFLYWRVTRDEGYMVEINAWKIHGQLFSDELFEHLAVGDGRKFRMVNREVWGTSQRIISIEYINEKDSII